MLKKYCRSNESFSNAIDMDSFYPSPHTNAHHVKFKKNHCFLKTPYFPLPLYGYTQTDQVLKIIMIKKVPNHKMWEHQVIKCCTFMYSFSKYFKQLLYVQNTYCVTGTVLEAIKKANVSALLYSLSSSGRTSQHTYFCEANLVFHIICHLSALFPSKVLTKMV